eukprot:9312233-Pyramimonas_sp.AAC.2
MRLMAHFSGDKGLCATLACGGAAGDPFRQLAARWRGCPAESVSQEQRDWAKKITYGLLYGMVRVPSDMHSERSPCRHHVPGAPAPRCAPGATFSNTYTCVCPRTDRVSRGRRCADRTHGP